MFADISGLTNLAEETNDLDALWQCYRVLSIYHRSRGENREAFEAGALAVHYIGQAEALVKDRIITLNNQACFAQKVGDLEAAIEAGEAGLAMAWVQQAFPAEAAPTPRRLPPIHGQGKLERAERWASSTRALAEEREQRGVLAAGWRAQGMIERARGDWEAGEAAFELALTIAPELDDPVEAARTLLEYSLLFLAAGRVEEGQARLREAEEQATALSLHPVAQAARDALRREVL